MLQLLELRQHEHDTDSYDQDKHTDGNAGRQRPLPALADNLEQRPHCKDRSLHEQLQSDDNQHLHLGNIVGRTGNQAGCREVVDFLHGEGLHLIEQLGTEPGREVGGDSCGDAGYNN
ncbi:hypothetical protein D3C86_1794110 [compost metagenome]